MEEWDYEANKAKGLDPDRLTLHSSKKATWICKNDSRHIWEATLSNRVSGGRKKKGSGCPYCDGKIFKEGITDLATCYPDIAAEWDYDKNDDTPNHIHCGSQQKVWWVCKHGHSYQSKVANRTKLGQGCSVCTGKTVVYETSLASKYPDIAKEWDNAKNTQRTSEVAPKSSKEAWWTCPKGHSYKMSIASRTHGGYNCPYCSSRRVAREDSLAAKCPQLMEEWNWDENRDIDPYEISLKSGRKVGWVCSRCGHKWEAVVGTRTTGSGCPECRKGNTTSFAEQTFYLVLCDLLGDDQVQSRFIIDGMELDVYLPSMQLALEPGNWVLHESKVHKDERKRTRCQELGIKLITIYDDYKESDPPFDSDCYTCSCYFGSAKGKQDLKQIICEIVEDYFSENIRIALDVVQWSDIFERASRESHKAVPFEKSIAYKAPDLIKE